MEKKLTAILSVLVMLLSLFAFTACNWFESCNTTTAQAEAVDSDGKSYAVVNLTQTAKENKDYLDTEVSWYDENYNYYVYYLGTINNVPLTTTYTVFTHDEGSVTYTREIVKTTESSIATQTSKNLTSTVSFSSTSAANVQTSVSAGIKRIIDVGVETGFTQSITNDASKTKSWSETVTNCVTESTQEKSSITLTFNNTCKHGTYLFLHLGHLKVYGAIIQSRTNASEIYVQTYSEIYANQYSLHYNGDSPDFPIDSYEKLNFDLSFVPELKTPTKTFMEVKEESYLPKTYYGTKVTSQKVGALQKYTLSLGMESFYDEYYYTKGYNKIKINYKFFAAGGGVHVHGYVCYSDNIADKIYSFEEDPNKSGKDIENTVTADLRLFSDKKRVYLILENKNIFNSYTVNDILIEITLYKE